MTMLFNVGGKPGGSKAAAAPKPAVGAGQGNKGTYVPEGLTKAAYDKFLAEEAKAKAKKATKFPKGKEAETLTQWMEKEAKKGNEGKGLLYRGHRLVKAKYDEWYTDISPV